MLALLTSGVDAVAGGGDEGAAVALVGHVPDERGHVGVRGQLAASRFERVGAAGVDDQAPPAGGEGAGQRQAEAARGAGDDRGGWHEPTVRRALPTRYRE